MGILFETRQDVRDPRRDRDQDIAAAETLTETYGIKKSISTTKYGSTELVCFKKHFVFVTLWAFLHCEMVVNHQPGSMFSCCSFLTGWNLLPVPTAEKNLEDVANMYVLIHSSTAWISPPPATISACHADRTECDRLSFSDQMMRHNRLSGSRLLSSSGMTCFQRLTHCALHLKGN